MRRAPQPLCTLPGHLLRIRIAMLPVEQLFGKPSPGARVRASRATGTAAPLQSYGRLFAALALLLGGGGADGGDEGERACGG